MRMAELLQSYMSQAEMAETWQHLPARMAAAV